ncbi:peptide deformylase [Clostridium gasigenes]|uniref:peptide deformylase n=1 Tax=Clostridium gasigenes TaxID=94869 RepID=UPI0014386C1C|nr:peptide deformylase [Clostridium gasigenes]MBU3104096.1 peptide deformylase [Clostridium gasigenes]MBU3107224.1 peptide deformylase [Clostridium gasigenes]MBU3132490.1 peptide deformylase [Clostridium gasigenes]MBU3135632.1 peptide deformylase [Clostridium gasigenes]NKF05991.1 peptide deformylase [Clostridium gasigenes]
MAIRNIRENGDDVLRKKSKNVEEINSRIITLLKDMAETMYEADGVGLAAVQVGILKRIFVIDAYDDEGLRVFINPEILETKGSQLGEEGCLSVPGQLEDIERANYVKVKALNERGEEFILEAEELLARAILHEYDHLEGTLFIDLIK